MIYMEKNIIPNEVCVEVGNTKECLEGEFLLAAVLIELVVYFGIFIFGFKVVDYIRKEIKGGKGGRKKIR